MLEFPVHLTRALFSLHSSPSSPPPPFSLLLHELQQKTQQKLPATLATYFQAFHYHRDNSLKLLKESGAVEPRLLSRFHCSYRASVDNSFYFVQKLKELPYWNRGYYMAVQRYEISLRVLKNSTLKRNFVMSKWPHNRAIYTRENKMHLT